MNTKESIRKKVRLSLDVPQELNECLEKLAEETGYSKSDVLRQAIGFMNIVVEAKQKGLKMGIAEDIDQPIKREIVLL